MNLKFLLDNLLDFFIVFYYFRIIRFILWQSYFSKLCLLKLAILEALWGLEASHSAL
jgi:hypothetical protein